MLKGRSDNAETKDILLNMMLCKWLNMTPMELNRLPFHELDKYKIVYTTIMEVKPELLFGT